MAVKWTEEQQKVISLRDRNILVSAAAGSGKTAVLVQRILAMILDERHPVDLDRLLIMTFTRAAAGEMRDRISRALEQAIYADPDNDRLQRQMSLVHTAQITTIDSFCSWVIHNYFYLIDLDPGYRTADEGELKLLREDVLRQLLEDFYGKNDEKFLHFVECYAPGKSDDSLKERILELYGAAMSDPWPQEWLNRCARSYQAENEEEMEEAAWYGLLWEAVREDLQEARSLVLAADGLCLEPEGPFHYEEALQSDLTQIDRLLALAEERNYDGTAALLGKPAFAPLSRKRPKGISEEKKEQVKKLREEEKELLTDLGKRYFQGTREEIFQNMQAAREPMEMLVELTGEFMIRFGAQKREKNLLDFDDMEHFALNILMQRGEDGSLHMTRAARELSEKYQEVLLDEYQDSNLVQEYLMNCVSGWSKNQKNTFMVGDVKQSIYRFRLARPELFMEKYHTYSLEDSPEQRIDLHRNFRSRPQVLDSVNFLFRQMMGEDLGGISYDEDAALYPGAVFPEGPEASLYQTEVLLVEKDGEELEDTEGNPEARELEALAVAQRIQELVGHMPVLDRETGEYRPAVYGDIVVLLRTSAGWAETFEKVFSSRGIPSYTASRTGYFSAVEVVTLLNYLRVCDNPLQDIPLAGVLKSPIVGCTAQELAILRSRYPKGKLYHSVCACAAEEESSHEALLTLQGKLADFLAQLNELRDQAAYTPVHQLIQRVLDVTGYGRYARALPDGERRSANLTMLMEKAMDYEKTSYRGLFNFIRYIGYLQKYEVDYGEVNLAGAGEGSVQIMTIHKSKGLEFPIVFASGMGKSFNFQDMNRSVLIHPELGVGADAILPEQRIWPSSLCKQVIRRTLKKECLGEELRVLYVALTRAREKLIITGSMGKLEKYVRSLGRFREEREPLLPLGVRMKGKNYWSYILPALARHRSMEPLFSRYGMFQERENPLYGDRAEFQVRVVTALELAGKEVIRQTGQNLRREVLESWDAGRVYDPEIRRELERRFDYVYPLGYLAELPVKVSVSDLKKRSYHEEEEREDSLFFEPDVIPLVPRFMEEEKKQEYQGASRGTAYHRVMECLDYERADSEEQIAAQIEGLLKMEKLLPGEAGCVNVEDIRIFLDTHLGKRMKDAGTTGRLFREQPFVLARDASLLNPDWPSGTPVLVQGIIDAYFLEGEDIILVDYKTDRVRPGQERRLVELYHVQLEDYAQALETMTGKKVRETYIYSFTLGKEIPC
ncbi:MAG: helicase-exonuclease AddAB subunit AddA [Clostridiales bacterium]|nr:helicase-exonuclease AddAB subunit AddA [Clostridiales bacterium]